MTWEPPAIAGPIVSLGDALSDALGDADPTEILDSVVEWGSRVLFSGSALTFSAPEYFLESIVQLLFPITDPFMRSIPPESSKAERECAGLGIHSNSAGIIGWAIQNFEIAWRLSLINNTAGTQGLTVETEVGNLGLPSTTGPDETLVTILFDWVIGNA